jgi:hypothetical protein
MQREIGIIIRVKDAAKAKEEIKSIVDNKLLGNVKVAETGFKKLGDEVKSTGQKAVTTRDKFDTLFGSLAKGGATLYALRRGFNAAFGSFEAGAGLERAAVQFESSIGKINDFLPQLRSATRGTVNDMKLLETANRSVIEGLDPRSLTKMYQMATVASRKLGLESEQAIQTISNAIVRQDESALTTLGTILKTNVGLRVQNALIAKNGGVMSGAAAIAIRQSVIMAELNKRFGGFNQLQEDSVELIQKFRTSMTNLRLALGPIIGIVLAPLLKIITRVADSVTNMLSLLKDNKTFRIAAQSIGLVIGALASASVVKLLGLVITKLALFTVGLKSVAIAAASIAGLTLFSEIKEVGKAFEFAGTAMKVFYQLISSFDENTGISEVVSKDKRALGDFFKYVKMAAQAFLILRSVVTGVFSGISESVMSPFEDVRRFLGSIVSVASASLDLVKSALEEIKSLPYGIGSIASGILSIVPFIDSVKASVDSLTTSIQKLFDSLSLNHLEGLKQIAKNVGSSLYAPKLAMTVPNMIMDIPSMFTNTSARSVEEASPVPAAPFQVPAPEPEIREQNIQAIGREDTMPTLLKVLNRVADSNEALYSLEQDRDIQSRVAPLRR